jgi:hypothetical protein
VGVRIVDFELRTLDLRTRMPFRYGIAAMSDVPHLFATATVAIGDSVSVGGAADLLPPKWFTKDPDSSAEADRRDMLAVIEAAFRRASTLGERDTPFELWRALDAAQAAWAEPLGYPALLWGFGVSIVERALLDAFCRTEGTTLERAVLENRLGIRLDAVYPELAGLDPAGLLPPVARRSIAVRHTVGLTDPLTAVDVAPNGGIDDGLPQTLAEAIERYGLTHLKIKLSGRPDQDLPRLSRIVVLTEEHAARCRFTLDGNEQFPDADSFHDYWGRLEADTRLREWCAEGLLFVEQPIARDQALSPLTRETFLAWPDRPPTIVDESDDRTGRLLDALECGYAGTSHKNCKGVFRGIANACLLAHRKGSSAAQLVLSGEDLCNVGPVALMQDLAVVALLGLDHVERNGHHYFSGMSMFPRGVGECLLREHPDLYERAQSGIVQLAIRSGAIKLDSVVEAPFGSRCGTCL